MGFSSVLNLYLFLAKILSEHWHPAAVKATAQLSNSEHMQHNTQVKRCFYQQHFTGSAEESWVGAIIVIFVFLTFSPILSTALQHPSKETAILNVRVVERLIGGHLLWVVNWAPQVEPYQHNRKPFCDTCHILWTQPALVFFSEGGFLRLYLCLKIRASVRAN